MDLKNFQNSGHVIIPNFLSATDIELLLEDYERNLSEPATWHNTIISKYPHHLTERINDVMTQVREQTDIVVDFVHPHADYFNNDVIDFKPHQDHDPWYLWQQSYDALNFWMPLVKTNPVEDGLFVMSLEDLGKYKDQYVGKGANRFRTRDENSTVVFHDSDGTESILDFNIEKYIKPAPMMPGDLLLMRADAIHATQPRIHTRIAASIRCVNTQRWIERSALFDNSGILGAFTQYPVHVELYQKVYQALSEHERVQIRDIVLTNN